MNYTEIVNKLIGDINPVGSSHVDSERLENLKRMCTLVNELVAQIDEVATENHHRNEFSMKSAGEYAKDFLEITLGIQKQE
jgi:hypothetical protein